jgi:ribonuclease HI
MTLSKKLSASHGPNPKLVRWIYKGVVLPSLSYGCHVWLHKIVGFSEQLRKLNRLACLCIAPSFPHSPTSGLEVILGIMPLHLSLQEEGLRKLAMVRGHYRRFWNGTDKTGKPVGFHSLGSKHLNTILNDPLVATDRVRIRNHTRLFPPDRGKQPLPDVHIFTDGSKMGTGTGYGVHITYDNHTFDLSGKLPDYATVFQAEVQAIVEAGRFINNKMLRGRNILLQSDSSAALSALHRTEVHSKAVNLAINLWNLIGSRNNVHLKWIKAHVGHPGNEKADELAKKGTTFPVITDILPSQAFINREISLYYQAIWQSEWQNGKDAAQTRQWFPNINGSQQKDLLNLTRLEAGRIVQFCTGFNNLGRHSHNKDRQISSLCRLCGDIREDSWHLATDCEPVLLHSRNVLSTLHSGGQWTIAGLMEFLNHPPVYRLTSTRSE